MGVPCWPAHAGDGPSTRWFTACTVETWPVDYGPIVGDDFAAENLTKFKVEKITAIL